MNIYLIPYNASRHIVMALYVGGAALLAWWSTLAVVFLVGPVMWGWGLWWSQGTEGIAMVANVAGCVAFASVFAEGSLRRRKLQYLLIYALTAGALAWGGTVLFAMIYAPMKPLLGGEAMRPVLRDGSLVTLRYRLVIFAVAGLAAGLGPWFIRRQQAWISRRFGWGVDGVAPRRSPTWTWWFLDLFHHGGGGLAAALMGAAVWHSLGFYDQVGGDLYLASGLGMLVWGLGHGLLVWAVPDDLYAGWLRVLSAERYGLRIPVPSLDGGPAERFVGHFPRGLDLYLPAEQGVAELHMSVVMDPDYRYAVRGLSVQSTLVKRFLERVDLRYDPRRPAPLETRLSMEDRIFIGADGETLVEFILLPKEER